MKKLYRKEKFKTFDEWFVARGIGGSSASALFDCNPYMSKLDLYCAMTSNPNDSVHSLEEMNNDETESTARGKALEPIIRELVKHRFKAKFRVQTPNGYTMYRRIDKPYLTATLDGLLYEIVLDNGDKWVLEIKTHLVLGKDDLKQWDNHLPQNYFIQSLHYCVVLNDVKGVIVVADLIYNDFDTGLPRPNSVGDELRYYLIPRDIKNDKGELMVDIVEQVETDFYENNVVKRKPPNFTL